jgi:hypothetical protein
MDTSSLPDKRAKRIGVLPALIGMVITFLVGVYVGLHPNWVPIKGTTMEDFSKPIGRSAPPPPGTQPDPGRATTAPGATTRPTAPQ